MNSDLPVRMLSAVIMVAVAGTALWLGGWVFAGVIVVVGAIAFCEWAMLGLRLTSSQIAKIIIILLGAIYIGFACYALIVLRNYSVAAALLPIVAAVATDVGAYFTGRTIGGPKIAPWISPSKTWSGLAGGMVAAGIGVTIVTAIGFDSPLSLIMEFFLGAAFAIIAQVGDFLESFIKRRAGVKDSGTLIPGHGGVLDRIDGLLAVVCAYAAFSLFTALFGNWA